MVAWQHKRFAELSLQELYAILALRSRVFVVEQACAFLDPDGLDLNSEVQHLWLETESEIAAYARLLPPLLAYSDASSIGRVIVAPEHRGQGVSHQLISAAIKATQQQWPNQPIKIGAQAHLVKLYQQHGFTPVGEIYLEDDIPHQTMIYPA